MMVCRRWLPWLLSLVLTGCGGGASVQLEGEFPAPLIVPLPAHVGLVLDDALTQYVHDEEIEKFGKWHVEVGAMQTKLFRAVIGGMFERVTEVQSLAQAGGTDGVLIPAIEDFQIAIPQQTRSDFYEVWIKYVMRLYDASGALVVEWPLTAYGKANEEDYGVLESSKEPGMADATMIALRDAGAFLALRFAQAPEVQGWLASLGAGGVGGAAATPETAPDEAAEPSEGVTP